MPGKTSTRSLLVIVFTLFHAMGQAAPLSVKVLEKGTGDPLEGATVVNVATSEFETSDKQGRVTFVDIARPATIKALAIGYDVQEKQLTDDKAALVLYLEPLSMEAEAVEVVADRVKEKASKVVMKQEELRKVPGTGGDPLKTIQTLPGVVTGNRGGPGVMYIRGSNGRDNSVWVNRTPLEYLYHFGGGISTINPDLVKDFNIFLGGFPVEYDDKLGGVIDVQLRNPKQDRIHQNYRVAINEAAALVEGPIRSIDNKTSFYAAGRISYLDKVLTPGIINKIIERGTKNGEDVPVSIVALPKYFDAQASVHHELPKGSVDLSYFAAGDSMALTLIGAAKSDPEIAGQLSLKLGYQSTSVNWRQNWNDMLTQYTTYSLKQVSESQQIGHDAQGTPYHVKGDYTLNNLHPQFIFKTSASSEVTAGLPMFYGIYPIDLYITAQPTEENAGQSFTLGRKERVNTTINAGSLAPYVKYRQTWAERLTATLGMRYSYVRATGGVELQGLSPRSSIEYKLTDKILLTGSWGKYIQTPEESQMLTGFGNPGLSFTKAEHRIVGIQLKLDPLWTAQLEGYQKPMKDLVLTVPNTAPPNNLQNLGNGEAYGVDLLIKREYQDRKMGWLSYSYAKSSRTTILGGERDFSGDQPHTINIVWSQPMPGSWRRWTWGGKLQAHSGSVYTPIVGREGMCTTAGAYATCVDQANAESDPTFSHWEPIPAARNSKRLPLYYQLDVRIDREVRYNTWKLNLYLDLQNALATNNIMGYDYGEKYEHIDKPKKVTGLGIPLPFFGIEATF